jgi:hypothetical protein
MFFEVYITINILFNNLKGWFNYMDSMVLGILSLGMLFVAFRRWSTGPKRELTDDGLIFLLGSHFSTLLLFMLLVLQNQLLIPAFIIIYAIVFRVATRTPFKQMLKKETRPAELKNILIFLACAILFSYIVCGIQTL